jgi:hypothetical protein
MFVLTIPIENNNGIKFTIPMLFKGSCLLKSDCKEYKYTMDIPFSKSKRIVVKQKTECENTYFVQDITTQLLTKIDPPVEMNDTTTFSSILENIIMKYNLVME